MARWRRPAELRVEDHGPLFLLWTLTRRGDDWLRAHVAADATWWTDDALVVEPRYVADIVKGACQAGLAVR